MSGVSILVVEKKICIFMVNEVIIIGFWFEIIIEIFNKRMLNYIIWYVYI